MIDLLETMAQVDALCGVVLTSKEEPGRKNAWTELQDQLSRSALLGARAAALLPEQAYIAFGAYHGVAVKILVESGAGVTGTTLLIELRARSARFMEFGRVLVGVEKLSAETQGLFSSNGLERVAKTDLNHYLTIARQGEEKRRISP